MKAMIFAAGQGSRIRPITETIPKPMIRLLRKPIMQSIIEHLKVQGIDEIIINTSHLAPVIEQFFGDGEQFGVQIGYSFEGTLQEGKLCGKALGSAGGMKCVQDYSGFFNQTFVALCGDALIDLDFSAALEFHRSKNALATIVLKDVPLQEVSKYGVVQTDEAGQVLAFQEKPSPQEAISTKANVGIYIFEPEIFNFIPSNQEYDLGGQLFPKLTESRAPLFAVSLPFQWVDIGSIEGYWKACRDILCNRVQGYRLPGCEIQPGIRTGINVKMNVDKVEIVPPVFIGSGTTIEDGATIVGPSVLGSNCRVETGAVITECLIGDYVRVRSPARLQETIVFGNKCIKPSGVFVDIEESDIGWLIDDSRKEEEFSETHQVLLELAGIKEFGKGGPHATK